MMNKLFIQVKYLICAAAFFALLLAVPLPALAAGNGAASASDGQTADQESTSYEVYIDDAADLLTDAEEQSLQTQLEDLTSYGNMMFTTVTLSDSDYEGHAEDVYYEHFGNEPGVNFQIDMGNRKLTLSCSTEMENELGSERDSIVDNIYTLATDGDYAGCASECFQEIYKVLNDERIAHKMKYINNAILALIIGLMLNFILIFAQTGGRASAKYHKKTAHVALQIDQVSRINGSVTKTYSPVSDNSGGGGGFGGGSSGGGGGGFSGGSSSHGF